MCDSSVRKLIRLSVVILGAKGKVIIVLILARVKVRRWLVAATNPRVGEGSIIMLGLGLKAIMIVP